MYFLITVFVGMFFFGSNTAYTEVEASAVENNNAFACKLMGAMPEGNFCLSPFNIRSTCTMALLGAQGQTKMQMQEVLLYSSQTSTQELGALLSLLSPVVDSAFAVAVDRHFTVKPSYLSLVKETCQAELFSVDFSDSKSRSVINDWVANKTEKKIEKLLEPNDIHSQTKMILLGASFCKAKWQYPFDPKVTHDAPFYSEDGSSKVSKMMTQDATLEVFQNTRDTVVVLGCDLPIEAVVVQTPLSAGKISTKTIAAWRKKAKRQFVRLFMPKCKVHERLNLKSTLVGLGMKDAFSDLADFSEIDAASSIKIDSVIHEALIEIKEEGIAAAAATAVAFGMKAFLPVVPEKVIRIDRPFYVFLRDVKSGSILFVARVNKLS